MVYFMIKIKLECLKCFYVRQYSDKYNVGYGSEILTTNSLWCGEKKCSIVSQYIVFSHYSVIQWLLRLIFSIVGLLPFTPFSCFLLQRLVPAQMLPKLSPLTSRELVYSYQCNVVYWQVSFALVMKNPNDHNQGSNPGQHCYRY